MKYIHNFCVLLSLIPDIFGLMSVFMLENCISNPFSLRLSGTISCHWYFVNFNRYTHHDVMESFGSLYFFFTWVKLVFCSHFFFFLGSWWKELTYTRIAKEMIYCIHYCKNTSDNYISRVAHCNETETSIEWRRHT